MTNDLATRKNTIYLLAICVLQLGNSPHQWKPLPHLGLLPAAGGVQVSQ